jgi:outer membrane receptor protein involved in Fe transport
MIRGLFGPRVLILTDGSRLEDYSWSDEDGPSLDARIAERIEVIRGPASVLYGSDALSGVVNVIPAELSYASGPLREHDGGFELYGGSNNIELGTALMASGAKARHAWRVIGTGRFSQNYRTPTGEMPNSSFWAFNGEGAYGIRSENGTTTFRAAHYGGEFHLLEATGPDPNEPDGGPVRQTLDDRLQVTSNYLTRGLRLETKAQFQRHSLAEVSDDCVPPPGQTTCTPVKDEKAFGLVLNTGILDFMVHHGGPSWLTGTVGVSGMLQSSASSGPIFLVPSASTKSAAAFAFEQLDFGRLSFVAGARGDTRSLSSDEQAEITRPPDSRSWTQTSGDVGVVLDLVGGLSVVSNVGTGWRAPTLFDLYANGPNLAEGRFEIGDPTLDTERSRTLDAGLRWASSGVRAEVSAFDNRVEDFIFTTPTAQTQNGLRVFRHLQTDARLYGGEAALEARVGDVFTLRASHDIVRGDDRTNDVPLPLMPPQRTIVGADADLFDRFGASKLRVGGDVEINQEQTRLNPEDFPTDGYTLVNFDFSYERLFRRRPTRVDLLVRNAFNTTYRDYLSRFKEFASAPGINVILKVSAGNF